MYLISNLRNKILCGDVITELKKIPDNSIDTIITSPPYFGLRDYGEEVNTIWGGDKNCQHEFEIETMKKSNAAVKQGPNSIISQSHTEPKKWKSGFCKKCDAWYGQLGLEPNLELYISSMLLVMAELKRVLRPTGILWWNHGDCYGGNNSRASFGGRAGFGTHREGVFNNGMPAKSLCGQNYRLILKAVDHLKLYNYLGKKDILSKYQFLYR